MVSILLTNPADFCQQNQQISAEFKLVHHPHRLQLLDHPFDFVDNVNPYHQHLKVNPFYLNDGPKVWDKSFRYNNNNNPTLNNSTDILESKWIIQEKSLDLAKLTTLKLPNIVVGKNSNNKMDLVPEMNQSNNNNNSSLNDQSNNKFPPVPGNPITSSSNVPSSSSSSATLLLSPISPGSPIQERFHLTTPSYLLPPLQSNPRISPSWSPILPMTSPTLPSASNNNNRPFTPPQPRPFTPQPLLPMSPSSLSKSSSSFLSCPPSPTTLSLTGQLCSPYRPPPPPQSSLPPPPPLSPTTTSPYNSNSSRPSVSPTTSPRPWYGTTPSNSTSTSTSTTSTTSTSTTSTTSTSDYNRHHHHQNHPSPTSSLTSTPFSTPVWSTSLNPFSPESPLSSDSSSYSVPPSPRVIKFESDPNPRKHFKPPPLPPIPPKEESPVFKEFARMCQQEEERKRSQLTTTTKAAEQEPQKKRGRPPSARPEVCGLCKTSNTPEWRNSEAHGKVCNACGLFIQKRLKKEREARQRHSIYNVVNDPHDAKPPVTAVTTTVAAEGEQEVIVIKDDDDGDEQQDDDVKEHPPSPPIQRSSSKSKRKPRNKQQPPNNNQHQSKRKHK
ncbi:hypothetical protein DFA_07294 [Cavenderia fasciculata]|uniref:GATA-type domain-containing protein n=1 Tax=Cavenderia fasciculata TaxID=261658 RepID=F4PW10_CACFS|nr:uncharacterized protein DFA_07294 [Cavenderia fasciculata]EGG20174.1 hypothetical protein DFA_07294 [Cavenderia fasciculata]|eukprot:XP_004367157.1 hypothetical protein DFA_07294 [Cavenderia fasciculata]